MDGLVGSETLEKRSVSAQRALDDFCHNASSIIGTVPETELPAKIAGLLPQLMGVPGLLTDADCAAPEVGYGRNTVFICPKGGFSILAMVWPAGVETPIHDHRDWCALGVYDGEIEETRFDAVDTAIAKETARVTHETGVCGSLPWGAPNIHRIANRTDRRAISIHVYGGDCEKQGPNLETVYSLPS